MAKEKWVDLQENHLVKVLVAKDLVAKGQGAKDLVVQKDLLGVQLQLQMYLTQS